MAGPTSTSRLLWISASGHELSTITQMAFWLRPGQNSGGHPARNTTAVSNHLLQKEARIGVDGFDQAIRYDVTFTIPAGEHHTRATFEALTGYMPPEFRSFHTLREDCSLALLSDGPGEQPDPVVCSTASGSHAMGVWSASASRTTGNPATYGRFWFAEARVSKWNCVFREQSPSGGPSLQAGSYRHLIWLAVGTREQVRETLSGVRAPHTRQQ